MLLGIVRRNLHQIVRPIRINLNGVIPPSRLIQDLPDRTHIRFDTLRRIKLAGCAGVNPGLLRRDCLARSHLLS